MTPAPSAAGPMSGFRALRHPNFRLFWLGQLVSLAGTWMQSVAQGWLLHRLTASALMLGLLSFAQFIPVWPLALWAGAIADRVDKRRLLLVTQSLMLVQATLLALAVSSGVVQPWMVLGLAFVYGCVNTFDLPARQAFVIEMVGREDLTNAIALNSAAFNTARIVGPSIAGLVLATLGEAACFWLNAVSFVAVIAALLALRLQPREGPIETRSMGSTMVEGVKYAWGNTSIRDLLVLLAICTGLGFQYNVLLPVYTRELLKAGPGAYGALLASFGVGSLIAAARMTMHLDRWALRRHLLLGLVVAGIGFTGFAWVHVLWFMMLMGALAGFGLILYISSTNVLIQLTTSDEYRGRVMSIYTLMFLGSAPFGALLAGAITDRFSAPLATSICALALLGGALWVSVRLRAVAARERAVAARDQAVEPPNVETGAAR